MFDALHELGLRILERRELILSEQLASTFSQDGAVIPLKECQDRSQEGVKKPLKEKRNFEQGQEKEGDKQSRDVHA